MKKKYILFIYIFICILFLSSCSFHPSNHNDGIWYSHEFYYLDSGDSYYEIEKKEYTYDYSTFVFKNDNTIEIYKSYDNTLISNGTFTYVKEKMHFNIKKFAFDNIPSKVEISLENGDFLSGSTSSGLGGNQFRINNGDLICYLEVDIDYDEYYHEYLVFDSMDLYDLLYSENNIIEKYFMYEDNRCTKEFIQFYNKIKNQELRVIYPDNGLLCNIVIKSKSFYDMPSICYTFNNYQLDILYLSDDLINIDKELHDKLCNEKYVVERKDDLKITWTYYEFSENDFTSTFLINYRSKDNYSPDKIFNQFKFKLLK